MCGDILSALDDLSAAVRTDEIFSNGGDFSCCRQLEDLP